MLATASHEFQDEFAAFLKRQEKGHFDPYAEARRLAQLYDNTACSLEEWGNEWAMRSHVDAFFLDRVFRVPAGRHRERADYFRQAAFSDGANLDARRALREYRRLAGLFNAEFSSFERKKFVNLSHEANKAMNLNSYLSLMGKSWWIRHRGNSLHLEQSFDDHADLVVPDTDFIITLDADSVLLNDYALQLVAVMKTPGNERLAVVQTPYSAFPGTRNVLERVAGATTDIQYIVHQGFTHFGGTFWVGANALIRRRALDDIVVQRTERGFPVTIYIQDRTVIEDSESSVDLIAKGWKLHNHPDRLAYSATPVDFGSLLIQRRRWANGGLIILPKLLRYVFAGPGMRAKLAEAFVRIHYLISPATTSLAILVVLLLPFEEGLRSTWLPLAAASYFLLYGRDLVRTGYKWRDLPRVYALNLLLVPVNLGGVLKSLQQARTGRKTAFGRTPKISSRTSAPPLYILGVLALLVGSVVSAVIGFADEKWARFTFSLLNSIVFGYVVLRFIGLRECVEDALAHWPQIQTTVLRTLVYQRR